MQDAIFTLHKVLLRVPSEAWSAVRFYDDETMDDSEGDDGFCWAVMGDDDDDDANVLPATPAPRFLCFMALLLFFENAPILEQEVVSSS